MKLIQKHINILVKFCGKYYVTELYVFGSVLTNQFSKNSDIDFLVKFEGVEPAEYFDNYMNFKEELENLFSRDIDLLEVQTIKNPILKKSINNNKVLLYGGKDSKIAV